MTVLVSEICDGIATTLGSATGIVKAQSYDELTEGWEDVPMLQVYPESGEVDVLGDGSQSTFRGGSRVTETLIHADVVCRQRSHLDEDMAKVVEMQEAVQSVLFDQHTRPYFGDGGIKGWRSRWEVVSFPRGDPQVTYLGVRFFVYLRWF